jgi:hypothetical protein
VRSKKKGRRRKEEIYICILKENKKREHSNLKIK